MLVLTYNIKHLFYPLSIYFLFPSKKVLLVLFKIQFIFFQLPMFQERQLLGFSFKVVLFFGSHYLGLQTSLEGVSDCMENEYSLESELVVSWRV